MLLTSWIDSLRRTWRQRRHRHGVMRDRRQPAPRASIIEQLEDRTLLSAIVIESVGTGGAVTIDTIDVIGTGTAENPEFSTIVIRNVEITPASGAGITIDLAGDLTAKLRMDAIVIQSAVVNGTSARAVDLRLDDVVLDDLVIEDSSITGEDGSAVSIVLHDSDVANLTLLNSQVAGQLGAGVSISLDGTHVGSFNVVGMEADGVALVAVSGDRGVISNVTTPVGIDGPIEIETLSHGLSDGDIINVFGVVGKAAANGRRAVTVVDSNNIVLDTSGLSADIDVAVTTLEVDNIAQLRAGKVIPFQIGIGLERMQVVAVSGNELTILRGVDGSSADPHFASDPVFATEATGSYLTGGEWVIRSRVDDVTVKESRLVGATGSDGFLLSLTDSQSARVRINDNAALEGVRLVLDSAPLPSLIIHNNLIENHSVGSGVLIDATDSDVNGQITDNRILANAQNGIELKLSDSNVGGIIAGNTINGNSGHGISLDPSSTDGVHTLDYRTTGKFVGMVEGVSNSEPIEITSYSHGLRTGDLVYIEDVLGNTAANGSFHVDVLSSELKQAVNLTQTTVSVDDVSQFLESEVADSGGNYDFQIRINDERMRVTDVDHSTNIFTVERGVASTEPGNHAIDDRVDHDSIFRLEGSSGISSSTGVYLGGGRISLSAGAISDNLIDGNTSGAGIHADLPLGTQLVADVVRNRINNNSAGGLVVEGTDTNLTDNGNNSYDVIVGGSLANANVFDGNTGVGVNFTLVDRAAATFTVQYNTITRTVDDGLNSTNYVGDGVQVQLIGVTVGFEATNRLDRALMQNNNIGTDASTSLTDTLNATQTAIPVADTTSFVGISLPFNVQIGREELQVTVVGEAELTVVRGVGTFAGESHPEGDRIFTSSGGNAGRGVVFRVEEDSTVQDFYMSHNTVVNNQDDGLKYRREDEGRMHKVNPQLDQRRAVTIIENTFVNNGLSARSEIIAPGLSERRGAGIDIHLYNGSIDLQDMEIVRNVIEANRGSNTSGILLRAEADARLLVDIEDNRIRYNSADGIELSTRENDATDIRQVGGTWVKNVITDNGAHGIQIIGRHGLYDNITEIVPSAPPGDPTPAAVVVVTPLFVGIEGSDPVDGKDRGNLIASNGLDGMTINRGGAISFSNNIVKFNGTGGVDIDPSGLNPNHTSSIKGNDLSENSGIGLDINAAPVVISTIRDNLIRNNDDADLNDAVMTGDGIELSTNPTGTLHVVATGNFIEGNDGRGVDIRNVGIMQFKAGDPLLPLDTGRNELVGNRHEGLYIVNTADDDQPQDVHSSVPLTANGPMENIADLMLNFDTNTVEDNGVGSSLTGTGIVVRAGSNFGQSTPPAYALRDPSGDIAQEGGLGGSYGPGVGSNDGHWTKGNGRIDARVTNNFFEGNFGNDFLVEAYISTVDPPTTGGTWNESTYIIGSYTTDPLSRMNLVFNGNEGNGMNPHSGVWPVYTNNEPDFKRRLTAPAKQPGGPFSSGTLPRSACNIPWRSIVYFDSPPTMPPSGPTPDADHFQYPGMGVEKTFRVQTGFDTSGTGPNNQFETGSNFADPGPCGWDIFGTYLTDFVSVNTTTIRVEDASVFVGGHGDDGAVLQPGFTFQVDHEQMRVLQRNGDIMTVERGFRNSPIEPHLAGRPVGMFTFPDPLTASFPLPDVVDIVPGDRNVDAGVVDVIYSEDMKSIDIDDFALAFDDGTTSTTGVITAASHVLPDGAKSPVTITSIGVGIHLNNGDEVTISGILGNGAANGVYTVSNVQANTFDLGVNEQQHLNVLGNPTGGSFTLTYPVNTNELQRLDMTGLPMDGYFALEFRNAGIPQVQMTDPLEFRATTAEIQAALEGLPTIRPGDVIVRGGPLAGLNDVQEFELIGTTVGGDTFTLTYLHPVTVLGADTSDVATTITVNDTTEFIDQYGREMGLPNGVPLLAPFPIQIDDEVILVTEVVDGKTMRVVRAVAGTTAAEHTAGRTLYEVQETLDIPADATHTGGVHEIQRVGISGAGADDTFTISFLHPDTLAGGLAGQINDLPSSTTVVVNDFAEMTNHRKEPLPTGNPLATDEEFNIRLDDEEMRVSAVVGNTLTVERAINGSTLSVHNADTDVFYIETSIPIAHDAPSDDSRNAVQVLRMSGDPDGGTFTLTFQHPDTVPGILDGSIAFSDTMLVLKDYTLMTDALGNALPSGDPLAEPYSVVIEDEVMRVTSAVGNVLTVDREILGTTAVGHANDLEVHFVKTTREIAYNATADLSTTERQQIDVQGNPDGGDFTLSFLDPRAVPATLLGVDEQQELELVGNPDGGTFTLTFESPTAAETTVDQIVLGGAGLIVVVDSSLLPVAPFLIRVNDLEIMSVTDNNPATNTLTVLRGQNATLDVGHLVGDRVAVVEVTLAITHDATAADVQTDLEGLISIGAGDVLAIGGPLPDTNVTIEFIGNLGAQNIVLLHPDGSSLSDTQAPGDEDAVITPSREGQSGVTDLVTVIPVIDVSAMLDGLGAAMPVGVLVVIDQFNIRIDSEEMLVTEVDDVANTFTVTRGINGTTAVTHDLDQSVHFIETTAAINFDASAVDVKSALEGLNQIANGDILATGGALPGSMVEVEFDPAGNLSYYEIATLGADSSTLTDSVNPGDEDVVVTELQGGTLSVETALELFEEILDGTHLAAPIDDTQETITVVDISVFDTQELPFTVRIDNEDLQVTDKDVPTGTLTVIRGHNDTVQTVHAIDAQVKNNLSATEGPLPGMDVEIEFLGTLAHIDIEDLIVDSSLLTENGVHTDELAEINPLPGMGVEGALSVETTLERLESFEGPEIDIQATGGPLGTTGVYIEFRGPSLGTRDVPQIHVDPTGLVSNPGVATVVASTPTPGVLSVQSALQRLVGIPSGGVLVTEANPFVGGLPFFPLEIEFTRHLSAIDIPELTTTYSVGGPASTAQSFVTTLVEGVLRSPLEVEFTGLLQNLDVTLIGSRVNGLTLVEPDMVLEQWSPASEDVVSTPWMGLFPIFPPSQDPTLLIPVCYYGLTCDTSLVGINETQRISLELIDPDAGTGGGAFTLTFNGAATGGLGTTATAFGVRVALENLTTVGVNNTVVTGGPLPGNDILVEFVNGLANGDHGLLIADDSGLGNHTVAVTSFLQGEEPGPSIESVELIKGGWQTITLPYDVSTNEIQTQLEAMVTIAGRHGLIYDVDNGDPVILATPAHGLLTGEEILLNGVSVVGERSRMVNSIGAATTMITVEDGSVFPAADPATTPPTTFKVRIDDEDLLVTNRVGDTLTVTRAANGSAAVAHTAGKFVDHIENTVINGQRTVTVVDEDSFSLDGIKGDGEYSGGGFWVKMGNVSVGGGPLPNSPVSIEFKGDLALKDVVELIPNGNGLTGDGDESAVIITLPQGSGISAGGDYIGGGKWIKNIELGPAGHDLTVMGVNEIQEVSFSPTNMPDGGTFTLEFKGMVTLPIPFDADAVTVFNRLTDEAIISTVGPNNAKTTGGPLPFVPIQVEFIGERDRLNQPTMIINADQLTGITSPAGAISTLQHGNGTNYSIAFDTNEFQRVTLNGATAGEFSLLFEPNPTPGSSEETGVLPFDAVASEVQAALEALPSLVPGDVVVTGGPLPSIPIDVEFAGNYNKLDILPLVTSDSPLGGTPLVGTSSSISTEVEGRRVTHGDGEYTLSVLTDDVGPATHDLLFNGLTQLVDGAGNTLNVGADDVWSRDEQAPVASFVAINPSVRNSAVGVVTMNVSEDVVGVEIADFRMTRDTGSGPVNVPVDGLTVIELTGSQYTIDLNLKTSAAGAYVLSLVDTDPLSPVVDSSGNGIVTDTVGWQTNILAPSASFTPITSPRNTDAGTVTVNFTKPVTGLDIDDFVLARDGQPVSLVGLSAGGSGATWTLDVSGVTVAEGFYALTLVAPDSGIIDAAGNNLPNDAGLNWEMDTTLPTLDILDVTPDPRTTDGDIVNLIFSEPVDSAAVDIGDLSLTLNTLPVDLSGLSIVAEGSGDWVQRYTVDLRDVTDVDGEYVLTFSVPGGVSDEAGNVLTVDPVTLADPEDAWIKTTTDTTPPTANFITIDPDPRTTALSFATVIFSEDVTGVDIADFSLTRESIPVDLSAATVVEITPFRYAVQLLDVSDIDGYYELTLVSLASGIIDTGGNALTVDPEVDWTKGNTGPNTDIVDIAPDPRITFVGDVTIQFTDPVSGADLDVTGVDLTDFELRRDGLLLDLGDVTLTNLSDDEYRLDLTNVTGVNGSYALTLKAAGSGISDGLGSALVVDASDVWVTDTTIIVNSTEDLVDATPLGDGNIDVDLTVPGKQITLRAAIQEANILPGHDTIALPAGDYVLELAGVGEDNSVSGDLDIRQGLTIIGEGADVTTIDADGLERVLQVFGGVVAEIRGVTLTGGSVVGSEDGGGIRSAGDLTLVDVVVNGNTAEDSGGGINANGSLRLERVTVSSNTAGGDGGGIRNVGDLAVYSSTISGNSSSLDGGGLVNISLGNATFYNTTISGNTASRDGGGIHNEATLSLFSTTVTANTVDNVGGGVSTSGVTSVQNTLLAQNTASMDFPDVSGTFTTLGNNLVGNNSGASASFPPPAVPGQPNTNGDFVGSASNILDPLIDGNLGDNGGPTATHLLLKDSLAIDGGENTGLSSEIASEQRGAPRILDGPDADLVQTIDIGAVEFGNFYVNSTDDLTDTTPLGDGLVDGDLLAIGKQITLRAAVQEANALAGENTILLADQVYLLTMTEPDTVDPTADIIDITPDPRDTPVGTVTVSFDEDVINVDLSDGAPDFVLTRDIGSGPVVVPLSGVGANQINNTTYTLDLSSVTDVNGMYELTLVAAASSIVDLVGNPLSGDAVDAWLTGPDVYAPIADIVDVTPDPRSSEVGVITINFNEAVTGVDIADFVLGVDFGGGGGMSNLPLTGVQLLEVTPDQYTMDLSGSLTLPDGTYELMLVAAGSGIQDLSGNLLAVDAMDQWVKGPDSVAPTADIVDVLPDPRITNVGLVTVDFSEWVTGVDLGDFTLTRDSGSGAINIPLAGVTLSQLSNTQYTLNLNTVTGFDGVYVLTLVASGSNIQDISGNVIQADASDSWQRGESSDGSGDLDITDNTGRLTIIGEGGTIIDANGIDRAFQVLTGVSATLRSLIVTGGVVTGSSEGGAVHNSGTLLAQEVTFSGNLSAASGGAVFNTSTGDATLDSSLVTLNQAFDGGGVYNNDNALMSIRNSEIISNIAGNDGGGVYNDLDGGVVLSNSDVMNNVALGQGGGVYNNDAADLTINNSRFSVNISQDGAAVFNELASVLSVTNTTFTANAASDDGGAIYNDDGTVISSRTIYASNTAAGSGGAIYNASNGDVTLSNDTFALNSSTTRGGSANNFGLMTVVDSSFSHNTAVDGGAIATARSLDVSGSTFSENDAGDDGGAIYNDEVGLVTLDRSSFLQNTAVDDGGAVANSDTGDMTVSFSALTGNIAGSDGGAIHNTSNTGLTVLAALIFDNESSGSGGGLANDSVGVATVVNTTLSGNRSSTGGGFVNQGEMLLTHSTIYKNQATDGGGISNAPTVPDVLTIRNTIIAKNSASDTGDDVFGTGFQSDGHNLIGNVGSDPNIVASFGATDQVGDPLSPLDPSLFDLQFNGGPTSSHGLQFGSPARDAGDNSNPPLTDQRGFARIFDGDGDGVTTIDIGAVESGFIVNSFLDSIDVNPNDGISADNDGLSSLRAAINEANSRPGRDTIILSRGTFLLSLTGRDEDVGLVGDLDVTDDLEILGAGNGETIIDADGIDRVFHVQAGASLSISGVTVTGGNAGTAAYGGGVLNNGDLAFSDVSVTGNVAARGGGVFNSGELSITESQIQNNMAYVQGGGLYNFQSSRLDGAIGSGAPTLRVLDADAFPRDGSFTIRLDTEDILVTDVAGDLFTLTRAANGTTAASHADGASIILSAGGNATIESSTISNNISHAQGGGVYNQNRLTIVRSEVADNVSESRGGGLYNATILGTLNGSLTVGSGTVTLADASAFPIDTPFDVSVGAELLSVTSVSGDTLNVVRGFGGTTATPHADLSTVALQGFSMAMIIESTLADNLASAAAGAIFNEDSLTMINSTISGNSAGAGGGIVSIGMGLLDAVTVVNNSAVNVGGVAADGGSMTTKNTLIAANNVSGIDGDLRGRFITLGNNLVGDAGSSIGFVHNQQGDQIGSSASPFDPVIDVVLRDNGGPTRTHRLLPSSPAIDSGDNTGGDETTDQRGASRPTNADADIGSYELAFLFLSANDVSLVEGSTGSQSVEIPVILSAPSVETVTVEFTTSDGTAFQGSDYQAVSGTLTFPPGEITQNISVAVNGDLSVEPTEKFFVDLSSPSGAELINVQGTVTILNDDTAVAIDDTLVIEGDSGQAMMIYTVRLVQPIDTPVTITVEVATVDGSAIAGVDYDAVPSPPGLTHVLTFSDPTDPNQLSQTVTVLINGDTDPEPNEIVYLDVVTTTVNVEDGRGEGLILNDDAELTVGDQPAIDEGANPMGPHDVQFPVMLTYPSAVPVTVDYSTSDGNEVQQLEITGTPTTGSFYLIYDGENSGELFAISTAADVQSALESITVLLGNVTVTGDLASGPSLITFDSGLSGVDASTLVVNDLLTGGSAEVTTLIEPALGGNDYDSTSGTVTFAPGELVQVATVTINDDVFLEVDESFFVGLDASSVTKDGQFDGDAIVGAPGTGTIIDNELPPDEYRLWIDLDGDYRVDWTAPDGTTEILHENADGTLPIAIFGDRVSQTMLPPSVTDDLLIIDFVNGNPLPSDPADPSVGLSFVAGANPSADVIELRSPPLLALPIFADVSYVVSGIGDGAIQLDEYLVSYTDVEAVVDPSYVLDRSFTIDSSNPSFALDHEMRTRDGSGTDMSLFEGTGLTNFGLFTFRNPTGSLAINAGDGDNTVILDPMDAGLLAAVTVSGGAGNDTIDASSFPSNLHILGGDDNDLLTGGAGFDIVDGGAGDDSVGGGDGSDTLIGGTGIDTVLETADADFLLSDNQLAVSGQVPDVLSQIEAAELTGGDAANTFDTTDFSGSATLSGAAGNDVFFGSAGPDQFDGGAGEDRVEQMTDLGQRLDNFLIEVGTWTPSPWTFSPTSSDGYVSIEQFVLLGGPADNVIDAGGYNQGDVTIEGGAGNDRLTAGKLNDSIVGGTGNDFLNGKSGDDYLEGGDGDDTLLGGYGEDTNIAGDGNDFVNANTGDDLVDAGDGDDRVRGGAGNDTIIGGLGDDELTEILAEGSLFLTDTSLEGDLGDDVLSGIEWAELNGKVGPSSEQGVNYFSATLATIPVTMLGGGGRDTMLGGLAADKIVGNSGDDLLEGGPGDDTIRGGAGKDFLVGGAGDDKLLGQGSNDTLRGENGNDRLDGGTGYDRVFEWADVNFTITDSQLSGGLGTDLISNFEEVKLTGGVGANRLDAGGFSGRAVLWGSGGEDTLIGGGDRDQLNGGPGDDSIVGNGGNDTLYGGSGDDTLVGGAGNDVLRGQRDDDSLKGGTGNDTLWGENGNDLLNGGDGDDTLLGGSGADGLSGWNGNDVLNGNSGKDTMIGGTGEDRMFGGMDRDVMLGEDGDDYIKGQTGTDVLSGGPGNDKGVDYAMAELGNWSGEIDEEFTFFADWIDDV